MQKKIKIGDLVVHIGANPSGYRIRMVCDISHFTNETKYIFFPDGRKDLESSWKIFNGWNNDKNRRLSKKKKWLD